METILSIRDLVKRFGRRTVIDQISLDVQAGEVFGFLGPNGAGKTTTIKMVMGFLRPDAGRIHVAGYDLMRDYEKAMAQLGGIVENPEMYNDLSGKVNLQMYARLHGTVSPTRIREVVRWVGMENRIDEKVKKYSLGMKQRVGLAQAILHHPRLLILDEPTNGLDPTGIRELRDILKYLAHEEGVAVFVSSHQLAEMQLMCDRVGIIHQGRLLGVKPIAQLMAEAAGHSAYRILTGEGQAQSAADALLASGFGAARQVTTRRLEIEMEEEAVPQAVRTLVQAGLPLYGIQRLESTLEEAFIQITGGGAPIA